jgi:hypothetical protein
MKYAAVPMAFPACAAGPVRPQHAGDPPDQIGIAIACFAVRTGHAFVLIASLAIKSPALQTRST